MSNKKNKKTDQKKPEEKKVDPNLPEVNEGGKEDTEEELSLVDEFNKKFAVVRKTESRTLDILRIRKVMIPEEVTTLKDFLFDIGERCVEEGRSIYLFENDCHLILWETIED